MKDEGEHSMNQSSAEDIGEVERDRVAGEDEGSDSSFILHPSSFEAWQQIESGRYMPRRIRGSCRGRSLG
jgi:hypothetical protein